MIKNEFKKVVLFFVSMMGLMSIFQSAYSQTVQTFSVTGSQNWTCPAGITSVTVECWGAGGGSGGVANVLNAASGGGGGGAYARSVISVTPGNTYSVFVGTGGAGGSSSGTAGANGGASSFNTNIVFAEGGFGGGGSLSSTSLGAGGNGGGAATSIGSVKFGGGMGAAGILNLSGGGGGSSAGNSTVGNNASTSNGGAAPIGGVAGASASTVTTGAGGVNGLAGGSGSAGARRGSTAVGYAGGFGGNGKVVLSYVCTPPTVASTQTNVACNGNNTGAVNITVSGGAPFTGAPTINQQQTSAGCGTNFNDFWQSFTPSVSGLFHSIDVSLLMNSPTVGNWYVYSGSGTGGTLLASGSYNFSAIGGAQWQNILITGTPFLISGQQYTFRMSNADWNQACGGNVYAGGTDNFGTDRGFRTYMTPAPYNYSWSNGAVTEDIINLTAGSYTVTVTDANSCFATSTVLITQPSPLTATTVVNNVLCNGGATGAINLTPSGGVSPYTFNWGGGVTTEDRTGLVAGVYTCTITDTNGCLTTKTSTVAQPATALSAGTTVTNVLCFGGSNGSINLTASGGTTPYTFNWGGGITSEDRTSLVAGVYTCTVTDVNTCTVTTSATITQPASALSANAVLSSSINCNGGSGIVTVNASGGTPTYSGTGTFTVVAGTYTYTVTDANGCVKTTTINVTQPAPVTITVSSSSSSICVGATASLTATGASTYTWNPGSLTGNTVTVNPISTTIYTATGTTSLGCVDSKTIGIVVNANPTVTAVASSSIICSGATTTLTGSGALTYTWNPGALSGSVAVVSPSATTNYTLIGTNASGCTNTKTISITVNSNPTVSIVASPTAICVGSTATLTATGANSYVWNTTETTAIIEVAPSVSAGYTVTGTDATGCINTQTISLAVNPLPTLSLTASPSSICVGATSTLTASGANTYSWSTGSTLATIFESPSATTIYTVIGTDAVGCVNTETVNLTVNTLPTLTISTSSNSVCVGNSATLTATGATTYSWSSGSTTSSEVVSPTATTLYTVFAMDAVGCMNSDTVRIYANALPNISTNVNTNTVCLGGVVVFSNLGANTFTLTPSALTGSLVNVPMNTVGVTVYTITGTASSGCTNTNTVSITTYDLPSISISPSSSTICAGQSVVLNATGANTYTWSGSGSVSNSITDFPSANTIYSVTGTDMNGCSNSASASVNVSNTPTISVNTPSTNVCMGYTMTISASGASNYVWSTGATTNSINVQPFFNTTYSVVGSNGGTCTDTVIIALTVLPLPSVSASASNTLVCSGQMVNLSATGTATAYAWNPGTLIGAGQTVQITTPVTYTAYGQGANGCAFFSTVFIDIQSGSAVTPITTPSVICVGDSAILSVVGGSVPTWSSNVVPNVNVVTPLTSTTYTYGAVDMNGCSSVITFTVGIDENCNVIIYNGFTPNGDGINDFWIIDNIDKYTNNKVFIYNRWGNEIFSTSNYDNTTNVWDGKANGQVITSGTYFFVIVDGSEKLIKKGWIEITN